MKFMMLCGAAMVALCAVACGGSDKPAADPSTSTSTSTSTTTTGADTDGDGVPDAQDKCPDKKEDGASPDPKDGCPKAP